MASSLTSGSQDLPSLQLLTNPMSSSHPEPLLNRSASPTLCLAPSLRWPSRATSKITLGSCGQPCWYPTSCPPCPHDLLAAWTVLSPPVVSHIIGLGRSLVFGVCVASCTKQARHAIESPAWTLLQAPSWWALPLLQVSVQVSLFLRGHPSPLCMKTASLSIFSHREDQCVWTTTLASSLLCGTNPGDAPQSLSEGE